MTSRLAIRAWMQFAGVVGIWLWMAPLATAQAPVASTANPFEGEWSLAFTASTAPGGATLAVPGGTISPYNCLYHAEKRQFQVNEDGTFSWAENEAGSTWHDGKSAHFSFTGDRRLILRASGKAEAPRTAEGQVPAEDRRLTIQLQVIGGNGRSTGTSASGTATGIGIVSSDGGPTD